MAQYSPLLSLITLAITIWCYWRILGKAGKSGWWAYLALLSLVAVILADILQIPFLPFARYLVPAVLIWIFAFMPWPSFDPASGGEDEKEYLPPGRGPLDAMPSAHSRRNANPPFAPARADHRKRRRRGK